MKHLIFGYGSLVGASGINGRGMRKWYTESDLTECYLNNYVRDTNAGFGWSSKNRMRFYGITPKSGVRINGVIFEIEDEDKRAFLLSEGFGDFEDEDLRPYDMVDVSKDIVGFNTNGRKVWTCVSRNPSPIGEVTIQYRYKVYFAMLHRSEKFKSEFSPKIWKDLKHVEQF